MKSTPHQQPEVLQVEVTTRCNLNCTFCKARPDDVKSRGDLRYEVYERVVSRLEGIIDRVNLWGAGEPMLHPDFFRMANKASELGIKRIKVSTNGHFLTAENIAKILDCGITQMRVALDHPSEKDYISGRRGGDFYRVVNGIADLCAERSKQNSPLRVVVCAVNSHLFAVEENPVKKIAATLGADAFEAQYDIWDESGLHTKVPPQKRCAYPYKYITLLAHGLVAPCCHVWHPEWLLGDANTEDIRAIWEGENARRLRRAFANGEFPFCAICNYTGPIELRNIEKNVKEL